MFLIKELHLTYKKYEWHAYFFFFLKITSAEKQNMSSWTEHQLCPLFATQNRHTFWISVISVSFI